MDPIKIVSTLKKFYATQDTSCNALIYKVYNPSHNYVGAVTPSDTLRPYLKWLFYPNTGQGFVFHFTATELMDLTCILSQVKEIYIKKHLNTDYAEDFGTTED